MKLTGSSWYLYLYRDYHVSPQSTIFAILPEEQIRPNYGNLDVKAVRDGERYLRFFMREFAVPLAMPDLVGFLSIYIVRYDSTTEQITTSPDIPQFQSL